MEHKTNETHPETKRGLTEQEAFQRLAALCAQAEHCQHEMLEKMRKWQLDEQQQAAVMARLLAGRYVDDERYARALVRDKVRYNKWGRRKVEQALWQKHIDEDIRRRVLDETADADYLDVLRPLLQQRRRTVKAANEHELRRKLAAFALQRGFTYDLIRQCIDIDSDDDETDFLA